MEARMGDWSKESPHLQGRRKDNKCHETWGWVRACPHLHPPLHGLTKTSTQTLTGRNRLECFVSLPPILPQWVLIMQPSWHVTWHVAPAACLISDQCGSGSGASGVTGDSRLEAGVFQPNTAASCSLVFINSDTNTTWHGASRVTLVQHSALHPIRHSSITLCNVILAICKVDCRGRVTLWCIMRGMR